MNPLRSVSRRFWPLVLAAAFFATLGGPIARAEDAPERGGGPPHGKGKPGAHVSKRAAWKPQHAAGVLNPKVIEATGPPYVGRAGMVINGAGTVAYTKNFLGLNATCDADPRTSNEWQPTQAYALHDNVAPPSVGGAKFMATNAGTSGAVEPAWPLAFGGTVVDGTITWVNAGEFWVSGQAYQAGMVEQPSSVTVYRLGFLFQAQNAGTAGATEPVWPTVAGATGQRQRHHLEGHRLLSRKLHGLQPDGNHIACLRRRRDEARRRGRSRSRRQRRAGHGLERLPCHERLRQGRIPRREHGLHPQR